MCPHKEGGRELNDGRPLDGLDEDADTTNDEADTETDSSGDEAVEAGGATGGGFEPPVGLKTTASLDALKRDNAILQEIVRRQDEVLVEMDLRIKEIKAATAQRQEELQALRAARALREAAATAEQATESEAATAAEAAAAAEETIVSNEAAATEEGMKTTEAACARSDEVSEKVSDEVTTTKPGCCTGQGVDIKENSDYMTKDKTENK